MYSIKYLKNTFFLASASNVHVAVVLQRGIYTYA